MKSNTITPLTRLPLVSVLCFLLLSPFATQGQLVGESSASGSAQGDRFSGIGSAKTLTTTGRDFP